MFGWYDGVVDLDDMAVGTDQKPNPGRIGLFRLDHAIGFARGFFRITQQIEGKVELLLKSTVILGAIERSAQDHGILGCKILDSITEPFAFNGSARCVGLWIPPQNHVVALVLFQGRGHPLLVTHGKGGRQIPYFR